MHFIIISEDEEKEIVNDIWELNTNYLLVEIEDLFDEGLVELLKDYKTILVVKSEIFKKLEINEVLKQFKKLNITPIFLNRDDSSFTHIMVLALEELLPDAIEYTINEDNIDYKEFLELCSYLLWEGFDEFDNTLQTPRRREE